MSVSCVLLSFRNVDDVHSFMDDIVEQHEISDELSDALSNAVSLSQDVSDVSALSSCVL